MTTALTSVSRYLAPLLLALGAVLAAANWYLEPERIRSWTVALLGLAALALVLWVGLRRASASAAPRQAADAIRSGIIFAALILAVSLSVDLAQTLGAIGDRDVSQRLTMVIVGVFFMFTGNAMPKMLTPLSVLQCDGAKTQAFQRFTGWTFVLAGLAFAAAWLVLPSDIAKPVSVTLILAAGLAVMTQAVRLRRVPRSG
jgi:uncharacterized membrane protein